MTEIDDMRQKASLIGAYENQMFDCDETFRELFEALYEKIKNWIKNLLKPNNP